MATALISPDDQERQERRRPEGRDKNVQRFNL